MDKKYNVGSRNVGVTVARFQIDALHPAHEELIKIMMDTHDRIIIVLGVSPLECTSKNPLDLKMRKQMIFDTFPAKYLTNIKIVYLKDCETNKLWSNKLDNVIKSNIDTKETVRLCGGRDSFLPYYENDHEQWVIKNFTQDVFMSATSRRIDIANETTFDNQFRKGVIYSACNMQPQCVPSIDLAIFNTDRTKILLGKRVGDTKLSLIGAWVQARETYEDACIRTARQKLGLEINQLIPRKSFADFDWRFRGEENNLTTMLYTAIINSTTSPVPKSNLVSVEWVDLNDINKVITNTHKHIAKYISMNYDEFFNVYYK